MESDEKPTLIIRADANAKIGSGHIMRMFALAQSWQMQEGNIVFVTNCESIALIEKLKNEGFEIVELDESFPDAKDFETTKEVLDKFPNSWCVVDGYNFDNDYYGLIRQNDNRVLVIDDTVRLPFYDADAILNQNINAEKLDYQCPPETKILFGTKFSMLRQEFLKWQNFQKETVENANKILITMGGSDFHNQTLKAIRAIENIEIDNLKIHAVVGSSNPYLTDLEKRVKSSHINIELIRNAQNMSELMAWADLAISAAGSTCWELCYMQVPSVLIVTADNQNGIANGLGESGFAENLGWFEDVFIEDLSSKLNDILSDKNKRKQMSEIGRKVIDGLGTNRIIDILRSET